MPDHPHGVIYKAFLNYIQAAEQQNPERDWLERELGAPKDWMVREPEARNADEIASKHRLRHQSPGDELYAIANPHEVFFCDACWEERHMRVEALWAGKMTETLFCPKHVMPTEDPPAVTHDEDVESDSVFAFSGDDHDDDFLNDYAQLFGNEDAASTTREEELARRSKVLDQLGRVATHDEYDWATMDGDFDTESDVDPLFNPELEGVAYPLPPESVRRFAADNRD